jgi:two-component system chemotaxis response regulator CheB
MGDQNLASRAEQPSSEENARPIRVLIVDDSAFMRFTISKKLSETPGLQVIGAAHDGKEALAVLPKLKPDVITLDVEMPHMDGLTTLRQIMSSQPCPVIMLSSLTSEGARETVQALTWGAVDFIAKPTNKANIDSIIDGLITKIQHAAHVSLRPIRYPNLVDTNQALPVKKEIRQLSQNDKIVVIGASTGGPRALNTVVPALSEELQASVLIVQHMPVGFTRSLAERLNSISHLVIKEAEPGDELKVGRGLVAPGGFHMSLNDSGKISLNQNPPVHGVRPAIDVTMMSVAQRFGANTIGVVLTGMGKDGTNGCALIHSNGGHVIAEDESTCIVWGMPRSVQEAGIADQVVPLDEVASTITQVVKWN